MRSNRYDVVPFFFIFQKRLIRIKRMGVLETLSFAAILFLSSAPQTESLSIKRRAPRSSDADLTAALAVLQRHRRQTSDMDYLKSYLLENQDKIPPSYLNALNENYGLNLENYYSQ